MEYIDTNEGSTVNVCVYMIYKYVKLRLTLVLVPIQERLLYTCSYQIW